MDCTVRLFLYLDKAKVLALAFGIRELGIEGLVELFLGFGWNTNSAERSSHQFVEVQCFTIAIGIKRIPECCRKNKGVKSLLLTFRRNFSKTCGMSRPLRLAYPGAVYHVTCRGNTRQAIVRDEQDRHAFVHRLGIAVDTHQVRLHVYVLMDNHFHLVVETPQANLSAFMRQFNVLYTSYFNRRHGRVGHVYQGRFKAIVLEAETYLTQLSRYVHLNPVRMKRFQKAPAEEKLQILRHYQWSSLPGYMNKQKRSPVVEYGAVLADFGGDTAHGRRAYVRFLEEGVRGQLVSPWEQLRGQVLLGTKAFVEGLQPHLRADPAAVREQPAQHALAQRWSLEAVIEVVAKELGRDAEEVCRRGSGYDRALVMECAYRHSGASQREIGQKLGGVDYSWVSRQRKELREELPNNPQLRRQFERLQKALETKVHI